jgi:hypothetical protein
MGTDSKLGKHYGDTHNKHTEKIDKQKGSTAIFARHIGEAPDASQTDCTTCGNKYCTNLAAKRVSFAHMYLT